MILVYPTPWSVNNEPPHYLVTGDKAFFIQDTQTSWNLQRIGVPLVPFTAQSLNWLKVKLDPSVEHPLKAYEDDPVPTPMYDGGFPNTPYFLRVVDGDDVSDEDGFTRSVDGGTP